jgi:hypothetical protein
MTRKHSRSGLRNIVAILILLPLLGLIACTQPIPEKEIGISIISDLRTSATPSVTPSIQILTTPTCKAIAQDFGLKFNPWELVHDLACSPDEKLLAVAAGNHVHLYDVESLQEIADIPVGVWTNRVSFHPTLPLIILAVRNGVIQFRDTSTGDLVCQ